jgi:uncharacterized membrane protein SpoIIM required for sporulation
MPKGAVVVDRMTLSKRDEWARLEALLASRKGHDSASRLEELGWRYRQTVADLALARRDFPTDPMTRYLNDLVERAHRVLYGGRHRVIGAIGQFYAATFPRLFRETFRYTLLAFFLFFTAFVIAYVTTFVRPTLAEAFVPGGSGVIDTIKEGKTWFDVPPDERPYVSSFIMTNNIRVTLLCFAGGVLIGIPTVLVLLQNGSEIGAIGGLTHVYGIHGALWSFVAAHGFLELSVIFISGGAGLRLAHGILRPGLRTRRESIARAGRSATLLACGCVPLLMIAGTLEGFVSPSGLPGGLKFVIGLTTGILLYLYLFLCARDGQVEDSGDQAAVPVSSTCCSGG